MNSRLYEKLHWQTTKVFGITLNNEISYANMLRPVCTADIAHTICNDIKLPHTNVAK